MAETSTDQCAPAHSATGSGVHSAIRTPFNLRSQLQLLAPLLVTWGLAAVVLVGVGTQHWVPLKQLFLDASYLGGQPWYSGILNEANIISWSIALAAGAFGSWISARTGRRGAAWFLAGGSAVAGMLLLDVWIQFHSSVAPALGINSNLTEVVQASLGAVWIIASWREVIRTRWLVLFSSFMALGLSAGIDIVIDPPSLAWTLILEDGLRLLGVVTFTHYMVLTAMDIIGSILRQRHSGIVIPPQQSRLSLEENGLWRQSTPTPASDETEVGQPIPGPRQVTQQEQSSERTA